MINILRLKHFSVENEAICLGYLKSMSWQPTYCSNKVRVVVADSLLSPQIGLTPPKQKCRSAFRTTGRFRDSCSGHPGKPGHFDTVEYPEFMFPYLDFIGLSSVMMFRYM